AVVGVAGQRGLGGGGRCRRLRRGGGRLGRDGLGFGRGGLLGGRGGFLRLGAVRQRGQHEHGGEAGGDRQRSRHGVFRNPVADGWVDRWRRPGRRAIAAVSLALHGLLTRRRLRTPSATPFDPVRYARRVQPPR